MKVKILDKELYPNGFLHTRKDDVGYDLRSRIDVVIKPGEIKKIPTGIKVDLSEKIGDLCAFGLIKDRSGLASKKGLHVLAGVIDPNYRGEVIVVLKNLGNEEVKISRGDRIAQLLVLIAWCGEFEEVEELSETERGEKGFGSSGLK